MAARIFAEERLRTSQSAETCLTAAKAALTQLGAKIETQEDQCLHARIGSRLAYRMLGEALTSEGQKPLALQVCVGDRTSQRELVIEAAADFGAGSPILVESKFQQRCQVMAARVLQGCALRL